MDIDTQQPEHDLLGIFNRRSGDYSLRAHLLADQCDVPPLVTMEQKTEIADFDKPERQHMQKEAPDKLIGGQGHLSGSIIVASVLVGESHLPVIHR